VFRTVDTLDRECLEHFWSGRFSQALGICYALIERIDESAAPGDSEGDRLRGIVELRRGAALHRSGALEAAKRAVERAVCVAPACVDVVAAGLALLGEIHLLLGQPYLASILTERAGDLARRAKAPVPAWIACQRGRLLWTRDKIGEARTEFLKAHEAARRVRDLPGSIQTAGNVGMCLLTRGRVPEARVWVRRSVEQAHAAGLSALEATWLAALARIEIADGAHEEAELLAETSLALARSLDLPLIVFRGEWVRHYLDTLAAPGMEESPSLDALSRLKDVLSEYDGDREIRDLRAVLGGGPFALASMAAFTESCDPVLAPPGERS
jgi:tetratricopeptide (TPR) repeat protein